LSNGVLVEAWRRLGIDVELLDPAAALRRLAPGDTAVIRLDVLKTLDGVEPGLTAVAKLERRGVRVINPLRALLAVHDKLATSRELVFAGIPHPRTAHVTSAAELARCDPPVVIKPRFGSWGQDVWRCETRADVSRAAHRVAVRNWFSRGGALVQEVVQPPRADLRLLVAGGRVVGSAHRLAAPGEWRTNVSLGGKLVPAQADPAARRLGARAADAIGAGFVGVDLLPTESGWIVLELNAAVDFDDTYSWPGRDVFAEAASALQIVRSELAVSA
jgi:RimK family alpha-L-glutamate ligase